MFGIGKKRSVQEGLYALSLAILVATVVISFSMIYSANIVAGNLNFNTINQGSEQPEQPQQPTQPTQPTQGETIQVSADDDPVKGNANAPVTIIEFSEFQCPFCGRFARDTLPSIQKDYIDTGKVKIVYRDFIVHSTSRSAQIASECADEQGKYWEYHDLLFENQDKVVDVENLKQFASDIGLNTATFNSCLDSEKYGSEVDSDTSYGRSVGVTGTPSFFINGKKVVGAQPYSVFKAEIEAALSA